MRTTSKSTQAEIVAEARAITADERLNAMYLNRELIRNLKDLTGLDYSYAVKQARFQLQLIDRSGPRVRVVEISSWMPFYEFNQWLIDFNNSEHGK